MKKRILGRTDLAIAPIVLGGNVFGWTADTETSFDILDAFIDAGFNAVDTADVYSAWVPGHAGGESEAVIGQWLKARGRRDQVILATKVGMPMGANREGASGLSAARIISAVEDSLKRLKTDYIDLYQAHRDDPNTPLDETLEAFGRLIDQGKVRWLGASNYSAERLSAAIDTSGETRRPRYESLQPEYNLYDRMEFEGSLRDLCLRQDIGVICYYGLASGFLSGKYRSASDLSKSVRGGRVKSYLNPRGFRILDTLDAVAAAQGATPAQIAIAWLIAQPGVTAPIVSATNVDQLKDILGAAALVLEETQINALTAASAEN